MKIILITKQILNQTSQLEEDIAGHHQRVFTTTMCQMKTQQMKVRLLLLVNL